MDFLSVTSDCTMSSLFLLARPSLCVKCLITYSFCFACGHVMAAAVLRFDVLPMVLYRAKPEDIFR